MADRKTPPAIPAIIATAVIIAAPLTAEREGLRTKPYYDPAHIQTVCYGETEREMREYTPDECLSLLKDRQAADYAPHVFACVPGFADEKRRHAFAAAIDAAYNAGWKAFCRSPMAARFNADDWVGGCDKFRNWFITAKDRKTGVRKVLRGLQSRRAAERWLCLSSI